jgi:hypothetical protein
MFAARRSRSGLGIDVSLTSETLLALRRMIAVSDNEAASWCIRGVGYGYLATWLVAAGLYDPRTHAGIWLGGTYSGNDARAEVGSVNDGRVAQATTAVDMARLLTLIADRKLVDAAASAEMASILTRSVAAREVFTNRASFLSFTVTHAKIGLGPLKRGGNIYSEGSLIEHKSGRRFALVWQNYVPTAGGYPFNAIGHVVDRTIETYLGVEPRR